MSEEIVIKTETVKIEELKGREKQIYDYAYKRGYDNATDLNLVRKHGIVVGICLTAILVSLSILAVYLQ